MAGEWEAALGSFSSPILPLPSMGCCEGRTGLEAGDLSSGPGRASDSVSTALPALLLIVRWGQIQGCHRALQLHPSVVP